VGVFEIISIWFVKNGRINDSNRFSNFSAKPEEFYRGVKHPPIKLQFQS